MANVDNPTQLPHGQFSLRAVLVLVTAAAWLCAIGAALGVGSLFLVLGLLICLANRLGMLACVQGRRFAQAALYTASFAFAVSMFLAWGTTFSNGQNAWFFIELWYGFLTEPLPQGIFQRAAIVSYCVLLTLANGGMVLCPFLAHRLASGKATWLRTMMAVSVPGVWSMTWWAEHLSWSGLHQSAQIDFYVWCGAITVTALVLPIRWWQLMTILFLAGWMTIGAWVFWQAL